MSKSRNSKRTKKVYAVALEHFQTFLANKAYNIESVLSAIEDKTLNVYSLLDQFVGYLTDRQEKLSSQSILLYVAGVRSYLEYHDVDISQNKFKRKVTMPKKHRNNKEAIDSNDIRTILQNCTNDRLKVFILCLASSGSRSMEILTLRNCDIDFSVSPTKVHIRAEVSKTRRSHDTYISDEASTQLKRFIDSKRSTNDLVFALENKENIDANSIYLNLRIHFVRILKKLGLDKRIDNTNRRAISFHLLRTFTKTVIANQTNTDFSEYMLGHEGSTYYLSKEPERRDLYLKCMPYLTFLEYETVESIGQSYLSKLAERDKEIADLRQNLQGIAESVRELENKAVAGDGWFQDSVVGKIENILKKRDSKTKKTN
jgi:integrase